MGGMLWEFYVIGWYVLNVLCDGWYVVSVLCDGRYVVKFYEMGGMW